VAEDDYKHQRIIKKEKKIKNDERKHLKSSLETLKKEIYEINKSIIKNDIYNKMSSK